MNNDLPMGDMLDMAHALLEEVRTHRHDSGSLWDKTWYRQYLKLERRLDRLVADMERGTL